MLSSLRRFAVTLTQVHTSRVKVTQDIWRSEYTCLCPRYNLLMHWRLGGDMASFGCLVNWHEKETQQTYFPSILFLEQISMLYSYTWMLHCIPYTHHHFFCIQYIISGHLNSAAQNARAIFSRGESIQNILCIHCLIYLLYKRYTQHEFNSLINMPRLNLAERNRLWGFSLWCFTDCGSWTIQCFKINNFEVSWTC